MSKKKNPSASRKAKQGHPARSAATGQIVSIDEFRARSTGNDVSAQFMKWVRANTSLAAIGDPLPILHGFLEHYLRLGGGSDTTVLLPSPTAATLAWYLTEAPDNDLEFVLHVVMGYLLFLDDSGLWSGSDAQFEEAQAAILEIIDEQSDKAFDDRVFEVPALTREQTRDGLLALPLSGRIQSFMDWFGEKRDVTSKGVLTRKDIQGAAAALGVAAVGVNTDPTMFATHEGEPLRVTTAQDVPRLVLYWEALVQIGIIELGARRATMHHPLAATTGRDREELLMHIIRDVALCLYLRFTAVDGDHDTHKVVKEDLSNDDIEGIIMTSMLLDAGIEDGYSVEHLETALDTTAGDDQLDLLIAQMTLDLLCTEGLVLRDTHYRIPPVLKKMIAFAIAEPAGLDVVHADPLDADDPSYLGAGD
ncbi:hypothetical protein [Paeniglutamicibacter sp.]|uniref:hypothetical protein n=1 Tax=Paeniglutamicibacter sp. TaxID=1934391 RepID=UPI0039892B3C